MLCYVYGNIIEKIHDPLILCGPNGGYNEFVVITNVVIKRVHCNMGDVSHTMKTTLIVLDFMPPTLKKLAAY